MELSLICAKSENNVIGIDNNLPWKLKDDLKFFSKITKSCGFILMGKNTFESLGSVPLPERVNIVLSTTMNEQEDVIVVSSIDEFFMMFNDVDCNICVIGGSSIYNEFIDMVDTMYITEVDCEIEGDTYFPDIDYDLFDDETIDCFTTDEDNEYGFTINKYTRIK